MVDRKAMKPKDRFAHKRFPGQVFTLKEIDQSGIIHTECGTVFSSCLAITLLPPEPEQAEAEQHGSAEEDILRGTIEEALAILRDRRGQYGPPQKNFARLAQMISAYLGIEVKDYQAADIMQLHKLCRLAEDGVAPDGRTDNVNYALLGAVLATRRGE